MSYFSIDIFFVFVRKRVGGGSGAHWVLSTPEALTLETPLVLTLYIRLKHTLQSA